MGGQAWEELVALGVAEELFEMDEADSEVKKNKRMRGVWTDTGTPAGGTERSCG